MNKKLQINVTWPQGTNLDNLLPTEFNRIAGNVGEQLEKASGTKPTVEVVDFAGQTHNVTKETASAS